MSILSIISMLGYPICTRNAPSMKKERQFNCFPLLTACSKSNLESKNTEKLVFFNKRIHMYMIGVYVCIRAIGKGFGS